MLSKKLYSIFNNKCPVCLKGDFFIYKNPFSFKKFDKMNDHCEHCNESFNKEVGFYYGAMYVSYGINVAIGIGLFLVLVVGLQLDLLSFLFTYVAIVLVSFLWVMRISRLVYINLFTKFDPSKQ